ncbi:MAG: tetratricopeptide repeat protein [Terriglobales bacterium]
MIRYNASRALLSCIAILLLLHLLQTFALGQLGDPFNAMGSTTGTTTGFDNRGDGSNVRLTVFLGDGKTPLDRQSVVKSVNQHDQTEVWQTTDDKSQVVFLLPFGHYEFEVSAVGYLSEKKDLQIYGSYSTINIEVNLHRDPAAVDLEIGEAAMPPKARKDAKHAVSALKANNFKEAKKRLDAAYKSAPSNPDLNFLMGYLFYQQKDFVQARSYLISATNFDIHQVQALTLLGRVQLIQDDYPGATATLEKAVDADPGYWMAHNLLANAYLKQKKYEEARQQAELAAARGGKDGASVASLTLGQALVNLGQKEEGLRALRSFVQGSPKNPTVPQVRELIAHLESASDTMPKTDVTTKAATPLAGIDPMLASPESALSVKPWQPAGIDDVRPPVAADVPCPYDTVIAQSGERMREFVNNVSKIAAIEHLLHERVDDMGNAATRETRDFNYVSSVTEDKPGFLEVEEYRADRLGPSAFPDQIASSGFGALALVFHPTMRQNFDMVCEGLGDFHGQAAWLVHFRQRDDRPARIHDYKLGEETYAVKLKGRAWITADKFQIVRIESELIDSMPKIQLRSEHQIVEYGPISFKNKDENLALWLPKSAEIYLDFRKHRYFRRHSFDHYMLFAVNTEEKPNVPKLPVSDTSNKPPGS